MLGVLRPRRLAPRDAGKGKSRDFRLSQALAYPVVKKGVSRSSRKWMIRLGGKFATLLVRPVYLLKHAHSSRLSNSQPSSWGIGATVSSGFVEAIQGEMFCCQQKSST
jgi:hypothetical protein